MSRLGIPLLVYFAFVAQGVCSHWLPPAIGTPQLLLVLLIWLGGRGTGGHEILLGAAPGLLADVLEPEGLGRNYLLYAAAAWGAARSLHTLNQSPSWGRTVFFLALCSFCIPMVSALIRGLWQHLPLDFSLLFNNTWTSCAATVLVGATFYGAIRLLQGKRSPWAATTSDTFSKNRWNMLTD